MHMHTLLYFTATANLLFPSKVPFSETGEVRHQTLALYSGLELMLESAKSLWEQCHANPKMNTPTPICETLMERSCDQLLSTVSQQTALYCSKLLQVHHRNFTFNKDTLVKINNCCRSCLMLTTLYLPAKHLLVLFIHTQVQE